MSDIIRHKLGSGGRTVILTAYPNDGRMLAERFTLDASDARRLAWAILADLDPAEVEASAASAADRRALQAAAHPGHGQRGTLLPTRRQAPITLDSAPGLFLDILIRMGPSTLPALQAAMDADARVAPKTFAKVQLDRLRAHGLVARVNEGAQGRRAVYAATAAGRALVAQPVIPRAPAPPVQAARRAA